MDFLNLSPNINFAIKSCYDFMKRGYAAQFGEMFTRLAG